MRLEYWDFVHQETLDKIFPDGFPGTELEHASLIETSLMLLLRPDLVDVSKIPQQGRHKIAGPHEVRQIAELDTAMRIISEVLNNRAAIGIPMRTLQIVCCRGWIAF